MYNSNPQIDILLQERMTSEALRKMVSEANTLLVTQVTAELIRNKNYSFIESWYHAFKNCPDAKYHKLILTVDGYDNDSRELYQIPEVFYYFKTFLEKRPEFYYFLEKEMARWLLVIMANPKPVILLKNRPNDIPINSDLVKEFIQNVIMGMTKINYVDYSDQTEMIEEMLSMVRK